MARRPPITPGPRLTLLVVGIAAVTLVLLSNRYVSFGQGTVELVEYLRSHGLLGALVFNVVFVVAAMALLPASVLALGAGFAYGPFWGAAVLMPASIAGAMGAFQLARSRMRPWVESAVRNMPRFGELDRNVAHDGFRIVLLLRLSPLVPYSALNYLLGLTTIRWTKYLVASWLGMLPGTFLYAYLGAAVPNAGGMSEGLASSDAGRVFFWAGLVATAAVSIILGRLARRALASLPVPLLDQEETEPQ